MNELAQALWEAVKEPLRYVVLAIIPVLVSYFTKSDLVWAAVAVVILRFIDQFLHEYGKTLEDESIAKGLTRF